MVYVIQVCWQPASFPHTCMTYTIAGCTWKTPDDGQRNYPKNVEFYSRNKFEKLVHLVGFILRILLPSVPSSSKWSLSFNFSTETILSSPPYAVLCQLFYCVWFHHLHDIWWGLQFIDLRIVRLTNVLCFLVTPRHKRLPQHPILDPPPPPILQLTIFLQGGT
jgi:hypothetical protein